MERTLGNGRYVLVTTETHRRMGNKGLVVRLERDIITDWTLASDYFAGHPAWTSADIPVVREMLLSPLSDLETL